MSPTHTRRGDKLYRYYISQSVVKRGADDCPVSRVPAAEIENVAVDQLRGMLRAPEVIIATWRSARPEIGELSEDGVREVLAGLDPLWDELFPAEQTRVIQLLVERVDVGVAGLKEALDLDVTRCRFADFFRALGEPELGALLICEADFDVAAAGKGEVSLDRAQTIMPGAPSCTFRHRFAPR